MSDSHGGGHGEDVRGVRPSAGILPIVWGFIALSIVIVCIQGAFVVLSSGQAHVWPAADAVRVQLPAAGK